MHIEEIKHNQETLAIFVFAKEIKPGVSFFTPDVNSLQAGQHSYLKGKIIQPHRHIPVKTERFATMQEVIFVAKGQLKVVVYTNEGKRLAEKIMTKGDLVVLISGGHGFEMLEDTDFIEVKEGPYNPESKKPING